MEQFLLLQLIVDVLVSSILADKFNITFETVNGNAPLTKIAIIEESGNIFVGGINIFLHFDWKLNKLNSIRLGPVNDSQECPPKDDTCIGSTLEKLVETDDIVKILDYNERRRVLVVCGSAHHGMCFLYDPRTKEQISLEYPHSASFIGGKNTSVIVQSSHRSTDGAEDVYFVAQSYDGRNLKYFNKEFSKLSLIVEDGKYYLSGHALNSHLEICKNINVTYHIRFIYGFESGNYIYFLFVRSTMIDGDTRFETKLAQICRDDNRFSSFTEFPVKCNSPRSKTYNIASSAYFHRNGTIVENIGTLYVTFGKNNYRSGHLEDDSEGSALCAFSIEDIDDHVTSVLRSCFSSLRGGNPEWICEHQQCINRKPNVQTLADYCGDVLENGVQATSDNALQSTSVFSLDYERMTSVAFTYQKSEKETPFSVVIIGTNKGRMIKVLKSPTYEQYKQYASIDLGQDMIQPDPVFDANHTNLFLLCGRKVVKISLYSCQIHTTCDQCVTTIDPIGCGWCADHCSSEQLCGGSWQHNECPPFVHSVTPTKGPIMGSTLLTVIGENFGSTNATRVVYLERDDRTLQCNIQTAKDKRIICNTPTVDNNGTYVVIVHINDTSVQGHREFDIGGSSRLIGGNFTYFIPEVTSVKPLFGLKIGNTSLTITGKHLDIGQTLNVTVDDANCKSISVESEKILCYMDHLMMSKETEQRASEKDICGPINISMNGGLIAMDTKIDFCFMENPTVLKVFPLKFIQSGGLFMTIEGENFDSRLPSKLSVLFENGDSQSKAVNCSSNVTDTRITCKIPGCNGTIQERRGVMAQILLTINGEATFFDRYRGQKSIQYFPDPVFTNVSDNLIIGEDERNVSLELKGKYLNFALTEDDIYVFINDTRCPVITLQESYLKCQVDGQLTKRSSNNRQQYHYIIVKAGNLRINLGIILFSHITLKSSTITAAVKILIPVIIVSLLIICLILVLIETKKLGSFRSKFLINYQNNVNELRIIPNAPTTRSLFEGETDGQRQHQNGSRYVRYGKNIEQQQPLLVEGAVGGTSKLSSIDHSTVSMLEKQNLLIDREFLVLCETIAKGEFGCVYKGYLSKPGEKGETEVAVKTILKNDYGSDVEDFLNEAMLMKDFNHPNVMRLIGIALDEGEFPLVVLPFMKFGDVLSYIRDARNNPTVKELVLFGIDIARGMEYLSEFKFVHRDLAARNCMLDENKRAKVADFGLSRDIYSKKYYSCDKKRKLPIKWMAPESLEKGTYTAKSDVWSYGILLWELLTRGACPYPGVENWDITRYIKMGRRLPRPEYCPESLFVIMQRCWQYNPGKRPTFKELGNDVLYIVETTDKNADSEVSNVRVDLDKCTNYDYGDQGLPDYGTGLIVDMKSAPQDRQTTMKPPSSRRVVWKKVKPDVVTISASGGKQQAEYDNSPSGSNKKIVDSVKFSKIDSSVQII